MKISLAGVVLADASTRKPPMGLTLNGVRVVETVDFARAVSKGVFTRGNTLNTLAFTTSQTFDSYADAQDFYFGVEGQAPLSGALLIYQTNAPVGRAPVSAPTAALAGVSPALNGIRVDVLWTIQTGRLTSGFLAGLVADTDAPNTMRGIQAIDAGAETVPIVFPTQTPSLVVTGLTIVGPQASDSPGIVRAEQISAAGMVVRLTGPTPDAGFSIHWEVKLPTATVD